MTESHEHHGGATPFERQVLTDLATIKQEVKGHTERLLLVEAKTRFHDRVIWMLAGAGGVGKRIFKSQTRDAEVLRRAA